MPATAADLPPELFQLILSALRPPDSFFEKDSKEVDAQKSEISKCAMVCRYWARECQEKLFTTIHLSSYEDVSRLRSFVDCPISRIAEYIKTFKIEFTGEMYQSVPWLHLLPALYGAGKLQNGRNIELTLRGPLPSELRGPRSVHWLLPRTTHNFSGHIHDLSLVDVRFHRLADLTHLISELREVTNVELYHVTWADAVACPPLPPNRMRNSKMQLRAMDAIGCTNNLCALWLILGLRRREDPRFDQATYEHLIACSQLLHQHLGSLCKNAWVIVRPWGTYSRDLGAIRWHYVITGRGTVGDKDYYAPRLWYTMAYTAGPDASAPSSRSEVLIEFQQDWFNNPLSCECDWEALDEHICHLLPASAGVDVSFASVQDASTFYQTVAMPKLRHIGQHLRYSVYEDVHGDFSTGRLSWPRKPVTVADLEQTASEAEDPHLDLTHEVAA